MEPEKFGRSLGIGVRVAGNILRDRASRIGQPAAPTVPASSNQEEPLWTAVQPSVEPRRREENASRTKAAAAGLQGATRKAEKAGGAAVRGAKKFGQSLWGPLVHAGSVLWLEITGLFFALFAIFFAQNVYRVRDAWKGGPEHTHLLLYLALTAIFIWFSASSFLRARRKGRKAR